MIRKADVSTDSHDQVILIYAFDKLQESLHDGHGLFKFAPY